MRLAPDRGSERDGPVPARIDELTAALPWRSGQGRDRGLWELVLSEFRRIESRQNPVPSAEIDFVHVLSGRSSYLKEPVDSADVKDRLDDFGRMNLGISVARRVAALRAGIPDDALTLRDIERHGPVILYNGRPKHNADLRTAIETGVLDRYPGARFRILELPPDHLTTKGHFLSLASEHPIVRGGVAIITHAFHCPRVIRMVGTAAPIRAFGSEVDITLHLVDREFRSPGIELDVPGEFHRIERYVRSGDLVREPDPAIRY